MPQIATFVDTTLPTFGPATRELITDGWKKVPSTKANRKNILIKYYEYLVNTNAKLAGISPSSLTPAQLEPVWAKANAEYERYEMYVKNTVQMEDVEMGGVGAAAGAPPMPVEEVFASPNEVERMQPGYIDIDDLLAGFGRMGLGGGKRRIHTKKHHTKKHHTKKHNTKKHNKSSRKTRRH